jgi:hypothetical protein
MNRYRAANGRRLVLEPCLANVISGAVGGFLAVTVAPTARGCPLVPGLCGTLGGLVRALLSSLVPSI